MLSPVVSLQSPFEYFKTAGQTLLMRNLMGFQCVSSLFSNIPSLLTFPKPLANKLTIGILGGRNILIDNFNCIILQ